VDLSGQLGEGKLLAWEGGKDSKHSKIHFAWTLRGIHDKETYAHQGGTKKEKKNRISKEDSKSKTPDS